ncbi:uncharacterized protein, partial [Drosophila tropicalis]|uniref:uncharacterized protein n=1 Tax=Drosophila tropicalis TaxID=46794 RepID=UPI0035ABFE75
IGAIDGKHVHIKKPYCSVGANGRSSDSEVFAQSEYKKRYDEESLTMTEYELPYVLVEDDAFPLSTNLMKPFSRRNLTKEELIFNYRLSRTRRGILANRFRYIFEAPLILTI